MPEYVCPEVNTYSGDQVSFHLPLTGNQAYDPIQLEDFCQENRIHISQSTGVRQRHQGSDTAGPKRQGSNHICSP